MQFILVRHVETQGNVEKRFNGWTESPFTARGEKMINVLVDELAHLHEQKPIDRVITSPILRAKVIGERVAARLNVPLEIDDALKEFNFGIFDGLTAEEAEAKDPEMWREWISSYNFVPLKEGDCFTEFHAELGRWLATFDMTRDERVVFITHGGTLSSLLLNLLNLPMDVKWHFIFELGGIALVDAPEGYGILRKLYAPNYEEC